MTMKIPFLPSFKYNHMQLRLLFLNLTRFHYERLALPLKHKNTSWLVMTGVVTPSFEANLNSHSMCAQESSFHTHHTENGYRITNVSI
jgi:hypothetical protein